VRSCGAVPSGSRRPPPPGEPASAPPRGPLPWLQRPALQGSVLHLELGSSVDCVHYNWWELTPPPLRILMALQRWDGCHRASRGRSIVDILAATNSAIAPRADAPASSSGVSWNIVITRADFC
jgi:hypothetical protein